MRTNGLVPVKINLRGESVNACFNKWEEMSRMNAVSARLYVRVFMKVLVI